VGTPLASDHSRRLKEPLTNWWTSVRPLDSPARTAEDKGEQRLEEGDPGNGGQRDFPLRHKDKPEPSVHYLETIHPVHLSYARQVSHGLRGLGTVYQQWMTIKGAPSHHDQSPPNPHRHGVFPGQSGQKQARPVAASTRPLIWSAFPRALHAKHAPFQSETTALTVSEALATFPCPGRPIMNGPGR
jgi:hypothetical protein